MITLIRAYLSIIPFRQQLLALLSIIVTIHMLSPSTPTNCQTSCLFPISAITVGWTALWRCRSGLRLTRTMIVWRKTSSGWAEKETSSSLPGWRSSVLRTSPTENTSHCWLSSFPIGPFLSDTWERHVHSVIFSSGNWRFIETGCFISITSNRFRRYIHVTSYHIDINIMCCWTL